MEGLRLQEEAEEAHQLRRAAAGAAVVQNQKEPEAEVVPEDQYLLEEEGVGSLKRDAEAEEERLKLVGEEEEVYLRLAVTVDGVEEEALSMLVVVVKPVAQVEDEEHSMQEAAAEVVPLPKGEEEWAARPQGAAAAEAK